MMKARLLILSVAALCVSVAPAMAELAVVVDSSQTRMMITSKTSANSLTGVVSALDVDSDMTVKSQDTVTHATLDGVKLDSYTMGLTFDFLGAGNVYSANGMFKLQDADPAVTWDLQANFTSTSVKFNKLSSFYMMEVEGTLSPLSGPSILVGSDPWVFKGHLQSTAGDADGNPLTITVSGASNYGVGGTVALFYPIYGDFGTLQDLFSGLSVGSTLENGSVHAEVTPVPVPAALLLAFVGLGTVGLKLRRLA